MNHFLSRYLPIFSCLAVLVGCQCSEGLETVTSDVPKIDICVAASPGGEGSLLRVAKSCDPAGELFVWSVCPAGTSC